jgi:hypothetical protein
MFLPPYTCLTSARNANDLWVRDPYLNVEIKIHTDWLTSTKFRIDIQTDISHPIAELRHLLGTKVLRHLVLRNAENVSAYALRDLIEYSPSLQHLEVYTPVIKTLPACDYGSFWVITNAMKESNSLKYLHVDINVVGMPGIMKDKEHVYQSTSEKKAIFSLVGREPEIRRAKRDLESQLYQTTWGRAYIKTVVPIPDVGQDNYNVKTILRENPQDNSNLHLYAIGQLNTPMLSGEIAASIRYRQTSVPDNISNWREGSEADAADEGEDNSGQGGEELSRMTAWNQEHVYSFGFFVGH